MLVPLKERVNKVGRFKANASGLSGPPSTLAAGHSSRQRLPFGRHACRSRIRIGPSEGVREGPGAQAHQDLRRGTDPHKGPHCRERLAPGLKSCLYEPQTTQVYFGVMGREQLWFPTASVAQTWYWALDPCGLSTVARHRYSPYQCIGISWVLPSAVQRNTTDFQS